MAETAAVSMAWGDQPVQDMGGGVSRRFAFGEKLMMARIVMPAGVEVPLHAHSHEQMTNVLSGVVEFRFGSDGADLRLLKAGDAVIIPGGLEHGSSCLEDAEVIELFAPPREDWIEGSDSYLRGGES
jgi:quercetin dioxygenase-like cupin family protein